MFLESLRQEKERLLAEFETWRLRCVSVKKMQRLYVERPSSDFHKAIRAELTQICVATDALKSKWEAIVAVGKCYGIEGELLSLDLDFVNDEAALVIDIGGDKDLLKRIVGRLIRAKMTKRNLAMILLALRFRDAFFARSEAEVFFADLKLGKDVIKSAIVLISDKGSRIKDGRLFRVMLCPEEEKRSRHFSGRYLYAFSSLGYERFIMLAGRYRLAEILESLRSK